MKIIFALILGILLISCVKAEVIISEIMYAPLQNEKYNEWIEIYNSGNDDINLSGWKLCNIPLLAGYVDHSDNGTIKNNDGLILKSKEYTIITDGDTGTDAYSNFEMYNPLALHVDAGSLCGGLSNTGKEISLISNNETIDNINYSSYIDKANKNNMSLQFVNDEWCEGIPTPGKTNECYEEEIPAEIDDKNQTEQNNQTEEDDAENETIGDNAISDETENDTDTEKQLISNVIENKEENKTLNETVKNESAEKKVIYQSKTDKMKKASLYLAIGLFIIMLIYFFKSNRF